MLETLADWSQRNKEAMFAGHSSQAGEAPEDLRTRLLLLSARLQEDVSADLGS